jgi:N-acylneuraminate cytidylyltransferase
LANSKIFFIPARKGSKGLPGKNVKMLGDKPLISYTIEYAKLLAGPNDVICISSDDEAVIAIANKLDIQTPFIRPAELATDTANTFQVINHALEFYKKDGISFDALVLLQPTSPFREVNDFYEMEKIYLSHNPDMVVSVMVSKESPYFTLFQEDSNGNLSSFLKDGESLYKKRQDCPPIYKYNGSIYFVNCKSYIKQGDFSFAKKIKYIMPEYKSIDIDTPADWALAEFYLKNLNK